MARKKEDDERVPFYLLFCPDDTPVASGIGAGRSGGDLICVEAGAQVLSHRLLHRRRVWVGIRIIQKIQVGLFGFLKVRVFKAQTRNYPEKYAGFG